MTEKQHGALCGHTDETSTEIVRGRRQQTIESLLRDHARETERYEHRLAYIDRRIRAQRHGDYGMNDRARVRRVMDDMREEYRAGALPKEVAEAWATLI